MKPVNLKPSTYIDFDVKARKQNPKFEVGDYVRIWKYEIFLQKVMLQTEFGTKHAIMEKDDKLYANKQKGYDHSFHSWRENKDIVLILYKMS